MFLLRVFLFFLCLFSFFTSVFALDVKEISSLDVQINQELNFEIQREESSNVKRLDLTSYFYPLEVFSSQSLLSFESSNSQYELVKEGDSTYLVYEFSNDDLDEKVSIEQSFHVRSSPYAPELKSKVSYPFTIKDAQIKKYLAFDEFVDTNDDLRLQASLLAKGEDDTYKIAVKIASFIRDDITYDLSTLTENPNQSSSEVFESKQGVCREITNLFISMMRSLGIPARVVSGYAYTESEELVDFLGDNWGGHAWAEVYMDGVWVPFDLTYDEYGYVDSTHIVLDRSPFLRETSLALNGTGFGFQFKKNTLHSEISFDLLSKEEKALEFQDVSLKIQGLEELGFGSYGYLLFHLKNEDSSYTSLFYRIVKVTDVEALDPLSGIIALSPNEEKTLVFRYKLPDTLDEGFIYTFPFRFVYEGGEKNWNLTSKEKAPFVKEENLPSQELFSSKESGDLEVSCLPLFEEKTTLVSCLVHNAKNIPSEVEICSETSCSSFFLTLNEKKEINFSSSQEDEKITYKDASSEGELVVSLKLPHLEYSYTFEEQNFLLNYSIDRFVDGLVFEIYKDTELLKSFSSEHSRDELSLPFAQDTRNFSLVLRTEGRVFERVEVIIPKVSETKKDQDSSFLQEHDESSFFKKFFTWFFSLFK